jgi:hypothetical protein
MKSGNDLPWHQYGTKLVGVSTSDEALRVLATLALKHETDYFGFFDPIIRQGVASYDCIGVADQGHTLWMTARLTGDVEISPQDSIAQILFMTKSIVNSKSPEVRCRPFELSSKTVLNDNLLYPVVRVLAGNDGHPVFDGGPEDACMKISNHFHELAQLFKAMAGRKLIERDKRSYLEMVFPEHKATGNVRFQEAAAERDHDFAECLRLISAKEKTPVAATPVSLWDAYTGVVKYLDHQKYKLGEPGWLNQAMGSPTKSKALGAAINWMK